MGTHLPCPKGTQPPISAHICCGRMAEWIKMPLGVEVGLGPGDFVLDGDPAHPPQKGAEPRKFSAHVYCGRTAGWSKMPLGMEVGLSPGVFVLDRDLASSPKRRRSPLPIFGPFLQRAQCSHCQRCISYSNSVRLSVRLSVRPSHAVIVSKRRHVARCSLHRWIAKCV